MTFIGRLHPLIVHFPIALVIVAAAAEATAAATGDRRWHAVAVVNVRAGAVFALAAAMAGWQFASGPDSPLGSRLLEWHRWLGTIAAVSAIAAAIATYAAERSSSRDLWIYRIALFCAATLVGVTGHFGGLLVWGADFLRP